MKIGALRKIIGPMSDEREIFLDSDDADELVEINEAEPDEEGDLILSVTMDEQEDE